MCDVVDGQLVYLHLKKSSHVAFSPFALQVVVRAVSVNEHHDPRGAPLRRLPHGAHRTHDALLGRSLLEPHPTATPHDPHRVKRFLQ